MYIDQCVTTFSNKLHSHKHVINLLIIYRSEFAVSGSHHVPPPYLNTVAGKDISLPPNGVLHKW